MKPRADGSIPAHQPHCLGCGPENPANMGLALRLDGDRVRGCVRFDRRQEGAPGFAHGGAVATVLDDALGTMLMILRRPAVTANLNVNFRAPAFLGHDLEVEAWCERIDGRKLFLQGKITEDSAVIAGASALFIEVGVEHFERGRGELPESWYRWKRA